MKAIAEYTAKELMTWAGKLNILGRSAMKKAELYAAVEQAITNCHVMALTEKGQREAEGTYSANMAEWEAAREAYDASPEVVSRRVGRPTCGHKKVPYITVKELCTVARWARLPRKLKKAHRKAGRLI